jgi:DNA-binding IclR family transcriptional regulator
VAAQLELADQLANGPLHVDVLAERTQTHAPSLYRMLRALESTGIFTQSGVFANPSERLPAPLRTRLAMGMDSYLSLSRFLRRRRVARAAARRKEWADGL